MSAAACWSVMCCNHRTSDAFEVTTVRRYSCLFMEAYRLLLRLRVARQQRLAAALPVGVAPGLGHAEAALHTARLGVVSVPAQPHRGLGAPDQQRRLRTRRLSVSAYDGLTREPTWQCQRVLAMNAAQGW